MFRVLRAGAAVAALGLLAGCASGSPDAPVTWKPKPSFQGENIVPGNPGLNPPTTPRTTPQPTTPRQSTSPSQSNQDPNVVATKLDLPTALAILPDNTALVGERRTGRIVRVQPSPGKPVPTVRTLDVDGSGDGGLLDLALSPNYAQDKLIFAYISTATDNRVVTFTLDGPVTNVLTGIPRGSTHNTGRLAFAPDGTLLVGTGDAGKPALAADPSSLAGKVLRVSDIGEAAPDNPNTGSRVWTSGHRTVNGLCVGGTRVIEVESRSSSDPVNALLAGGSYGWPSAGTGYRNPLGHLPSTGRAPGGCALLDNRLFVTTADGEALLSTKVGTSSTLGRFSPLLRGKYGRLHTVVAAADGALWLTTNNRVSGGDPVAADDRVLRIVPSGNNDSIV